MTWIWFALVATLIVLGGVRLARYGDVIGEQSGLGRSWIGVVLLAATTSLPELFTGFGATAITPVPDIAVGDIMGSCMFNLLILSFMDALQPDRLSARSHQGHALAIGFGLLLMGIAGLGFAAPTHWPRVAWVGAYSPALIVLYFLAMRATFTFDRQRLSRLPAAEEGHPSLSPLTLRQASLRYAAAALVVVTGALFLPVLGERLAEETGLSQAMVGSLLIAVTTSLPEIVVSLEAVRMGAVELGVSNVLGSNLFNLLILGLDDVFYTPGPLLAAVDAGHLVTALAVILMNAVFLIGLTQQVLLKRFRVGWDTGAIAALYVAAVWFGYRLHG